MNPTTDNSVITIQIPSSTYSELLSLKTEDAKEPSEIITRLVKDAHSHLVWMHDLAMLRKEIRQDGGLKTGETDEEMIERIRESRKDIFETEYSHLYR